MRSWRRELWFDRTELPWVKPSPNMPTLQSAMLYPALVPFEGSNLSVGRGTPDAFQLSVRRGSRPRRPWSCFEIVKLAACALSSRISRP